MSSQAPIWIATPSFIEAEALEGLPLPAPVYVTGVGALATLTTLWELWQKSPAAGLIALGIAGSYQREFAPGQLVQVQTEIEGATGRRYTRRFQPTAPALRGKVPLAWENPCFPPFLKLPAVTGLTLPTVSLAPAEVRYWRRSYPEAHVETQENAAYFLFAWSRKIPLLVVRSLSNWVGSRRWEKDLALQALRTFAERHVASICEWLLASAPPPPSGRTLR